MCCGVCVCVCVSTNLHTEVKLKAKLRKASRFQDKRNVFKMESCVVIFSFLIFPLLECPSFLFYQPGTKFIHDS